MVHSAEKLQSAIGKRACVAGPVHEVLLDSCHLHNFSTSLCEFALFEEWLRLSKSVGVFDQPFVKASWLLAKNTTDPVTDNSQTPFADRTP